ncbi:unnamed protein product [Oikopleura dioica]|uniref:Uncharacterized protein n=1 Tax=Oikopleura dioica TaxID=34765 RepID=E4YHQ3_OIKDI|nr:unnamed protein product [Oikopleura dioica]
MARQDVITYAVILHTRAG